MDVDTRRAAGGPAGVLDSAPRSPEEAERLIHAIAPTAQLLDAPRVLLRGIRGGLSGPFPHAGCHSSIRDGLKSAVEKTIPGYRSAIRR